MAEKLARKNGWTIRWKPGGTKSREVGYDSEFFDDELAADQFRLLVEHAGHHWPVDGDGNVWKRGVGFVEVEQVEGHPFLDYANKRIRTLLQRESISDDTATRYMRYARILAGSMAVAPQLREAIEDDDAFALKVARDPALAQPLLERMVDGMSDEDIAKHGQAVLVEDLDVEAIRAFIQWMLVRQRKWKTVRNYHGFLNGVLQQAEDEDLIRKNPCKVTARELGPVRPVKVILTPEQFLLLLSCMKADQQDLIEAAIGTGCRFGELTAARRGDWFPAERRLRVEEAWKRGLPGEGWYRGKPKTQAGIRDVYVSDRIAAILDAHAEGKGDDDLLFTAVRGGWVRHNSFNEERWKPAVDLALEKGLDTRDTEGKPARPRFHDLRHTHVSWLRQAGLQDNVIKDLVGHTDPEMTGKYGEIPAELKMAAATVIDSNLRRLKAV